MTRNRAWTWRHAIVKSDLPPTTRHVLLTISCFMNDVGGGCYPTTKDLAAATGLSERAVCEHIAKAQEAGWLTVTLHGFKGQKWKNNQYAAAWPEVEGTDPDDKKALTQDQHEALTDGQQQGTDAGSAPSRKALTVVPKGTDPDDKKALTDGQSTSPVTNPVTKEDMSERGSDPPPKTRGKRNTYPELFEAFWQPYPRSPTMSKQEAFDVWRRLDADDRAACAAAVPAFVAYCKANPDYPPVHACRFITKRRFDALSAPAAVSAVADDGKWPQRLLAARERKAWPPQRWGPPPGDPGCRVPASLLSENDGIGWVDWETAA